MTDYKLLIYINELSTPLIFEKNVTYEKEYQLKTDINSIGTNGYIEKIDEDYVYYPAHKIDKIEIKKV